MSLLGIGLLIACCFWFLPELFLFILIGLTTLGLIIKEVFNKFFTKTTVNYILFLIFFIMGVVVPLSSMIFIMRVF